MTSYLSVDRLCVRHRGAEIDAVNSVSFTLDRGEVLAVLGSSGSGKSTLLRAIAGLQVPSGGRIRVDGVDITNVPVHERGIGLMFQNHALFPHLDVAGNVGFGLRVVKASKKERMRRTAEVLEMVGLAGFETRDVSALSGGEKQRVALARTLAVSPKVLLLDEPMGSLDRVLRDRLLPELAALIADLELTTISVTHDRTEAFALADRIAVMDQGSIIQMGTPDEVSSAPCSEHVAALLGHG